MYNTYKNEILNRNGKKKIVKEVVKEEHILSELEIIAKVEQAIKEKKMRLNGNINNSFMKDDENGSFNRDYEMLTHHKDKFKKSIKKEDSYPLDYQTYKKNFDTRKKEDNHLEKDSLSIKVDDSHIVLYNSIEDKNYQPKTNFPTIKNKNPSYDLKSRSSNNINPWIKYEYNHPGTYVINILNLLKKFRLNLFLKRKS